MTITPELEAMAKGFFESLCEPHKWEDVPQAHAHNIEAARAALLAIREPEGALLREIQRIRFAMRVGKITGLAAEGPAFTAIIDYLLAEPQP